MNNAVNVTYTDKLTASEWKVIHNALEEERQSEKRYFRKQTEVEIMMSECMKKEINHFNKNGFTILFTGNSVDNDEYIVAENGGLAVVVRNQGEHDRKFFLVKMCNPSKALEIAKRHCI